MMSRYAFGMDRASRILIFKWWIVAWFLHI